MAQIKVMKHHTGLYILLFCFVVIMLSGACARNDGAQRQKPLGDTTSTEEMVMAVYDNDLERALQILDSATAAGKLTADQSDLIRANVFSRTLNSPRYDSAVVIAERLLNSDSAKARPQFRQDVLEVLVYSTRQMEDYELQLDYSIQLAEVYSRQGSQVEALRTEAEVGAVLCRLGKTEEGLAKMDSVISILAPVRRFNEMDATIIAMKRKIGVIRDYKQIEATAQQMLQRLEDYEMNPDQFHDGTIREPSDEERPGYIAFYRAQAWIFMAAAYAHLDDPQKAAHYLDMAEKTDFGRTLSGKKMMAPTLCLLGEYAKMEAAYQQLEAEFKKSGDTLTLDYAQLLLDRAKAAESQGRLKEGIALWERHAQILQKAEERLLWSKANLYAARYHAQEQQMAIERQQDEIFRRNVICVVLAVGVVALLTLLIYRLRQQRVLRQKNSVLAREIADAIEYRDKYEALTASQHKEEPQEKEPENLSELTDEQLFQHIRKVVVSDKMFLDPSLDRQALCTRFSLTKEQVGAAFSKGSPYSSLTQFLTDLRLPVAAKLLVERPELTIAEVARASGFSRADTLTSNFKLRYALTPTQYRAQQC